MTDPDLARWPDRLRRVIGEEAGGNVSAFARMVTAALPGVPLTRDTLRNYLEKGSEPSLAKGCAIAAATGRNPLWLAFGIGPEWLPGGLLGMGDTPAQPDTEVLMVPYYRFAGGRLERDPEAHPFGLVRQFLPAGVRARWLVALEIPPEVENPALGVASGGVSVAELYDEEGVDFGEAEREGGGLRSGSYLVRFGPEAPFAFVRITALTVQGRYDVRHGRPEAGGPAAGAARRPLTGSAKELAPLRLYAHVVASWQHQRA